MFLFHSSSVVSSIGAEEARPALETRMSRPPNSTDGFGEAGDDLLFLGDVELDRPDEVLAERLAQFFVGRSQRGLVDIGEHHAGAFAQQPRRAVALADAAGAAGDQRDLAGQRFRLGHARQLGLFEQPVFDVEGFLLGQAAIGRRPSRRRASR